MSFLVWSETEGTGLDLCLMPHLPGKHRFVSKKDTYGLDSSNALRLPQVMKSGIVETILDWVHRPKSTHSSMRRACRILAAQKHVPKWHWQMEPKLNPAVCPSSLILSHHLISSRNRKLGEWSLGMGQNFKPPWDRRLNRPCVHLPGLAPFWGYQRFLASYFCLPLST